MMVIVGFGVAAPLTIGEVFDRVMQTAVSQYGEVLVGSVVEQLWSDYSLNSYYKHRED